MMNRNRIVPASLVALLLAAGVVRADDKMPPTVATTGTASVFVTPDRVDLSFRVVTFDADLAKAKAAGDQSATETLAFLKAQGVPEAQIRTDHVTSQAVYEERVENRRMVRGPIIGYEVTRSYGVRLDDLTKFGPIVDRLLVDPSIRVEGHAFSVKEDRKHRDEARRQAARAAREKAELLANELGRGVGLPRQIDEQGAEPVYTNVRLFAGGGGGDSGPGAEAAPVGQIEIRADVSVRFDLIEKQ